MFHFHNKIMQTDIGLLVLKTTSYLNLVMVPKYSGGMKWYSVHMTIEHMV